MLNNPEAQKLHECMLRTMANMSQSFLYVDKHEKKPFFANEQAKINFSEDNGYIDIDRIFQNHESPAFLRDTITEQLKIADYVMLHDVPVSDMKGTVELCEVQVGYADDEQNVIFIEIFFHG